MSTEIEILSIEHRVNNKGQEQEIFTTIYEGSDFEPFEPYQFKNWHVESECGAIFELQGSDLKQIELEDFDNSEFNDYDWYRVTVSY